jgi:3-hydroxybutyryl-CoA dehydratase
VVSGEEEFMRGKTIHELKPGAQAEFSKTISETDGSLFAGITGDFNPAHVNQVYTEKTFFKLLTGHGFLITGFISAVRGGCNNVRKIR